MSTPLPGQIRCPTCHRSTPPTAFCTQCGTAIPESARARPRGLDRDELQDRIRGRRPGDAAFRRGSEPEPSSYRPYQPEPEDELVLPGTGVDEAGPRVDNTPPGFDAPPPEPVAPPIPQPPVAPPPVAPPPPPVQVEPPRVEQEAPEPPAPPRREPQPAPWKPAPPPPPPPVRLAEPVQEPPPYPRDQIDDAGYGRGGRGGSDDWNRRGSDSGSGMGPLAIGGFVLLGILAIGVGAFMAGVFSGGTANASPTPSQLVSTLPSASASPSLVESTAPSVPGSIAPTPLPSSLPSDFTARTEPCAEQPASQDGCGSSGATVTGGTVWVWVGWRKGSDADTIGVNIEDGTGAIVGTGSIALSTIGSNGCGASCSGWARFRFGGLDPGDYTIKVDRNGEAVAQATFTVNS